MIPHLLLDALSWTCLFYGIGYAVVYLLGKISRKPKPPPENSYTYTRREIRNKYKQQKHPKAKARRKYRKIYPKGT